MHTITGTLKPYAWGVVDGLAAWVDGSTGLPQAELWFGAHPAGPSALVDGLGTLADCEMSVPLLVKLLAVAEPLSIQVHPDDETAQRMWEAQGRRPGLLADGNRKTEVVVALGPFSALAGWREAGLAAELLRKASVPEDVIAILESDGPAAAVPAILGLPSDVSYQCVSRLPRAAAAIGLEVPAVEALASVVGRHPNDPGALVAALMCHHALSLGDALVVPAGVVHAYISGLGLEVMTASDNVLRLGLTRKPIAVNEGLAALRSDLDAVHRASPHGHIDVPEVPAVIRLLGRGDHVIAAGAYRVALGLAGTSVVRVDGLTAQFAPGHAVVIDPSDGEAELAVTGWTAVIEHVIHDSEG